MKIVNVSNFAKMQANAMMYTRHLSKHQLNKKTERWSQFDKNKIQPPESKSLE